MTSLKTSIKTITYLSDIGCLEIQGASLGIYRTQKNADITDRLLSVPNSADPKAMYLSTERVPDILGTDVF